MDNFTIANYTNNVKSAVVSDECLLSLWSNLCEKHTKKLTPNAIRILLKTDIKTKADSTSAVLNELTDPFELCCDGAALYPDDYPSWESEDLSLCVREKDGSLTTTFYGEVMKDKMISAVTNLHLEFCRKEKVNQTLVDWRA